MSDFDIGILGAGAWGTALAVLWAREGRHVALWARDAGRAALLRTSRHNDRLPHIALAENIEVVNNIPAAKFLVAAVPMQHLRDLVEALPADTPPLVLCCKGLESGSLLLPPELVGALRPNQPIGLLTGPNFAHEVASGLPAAAVLAVPDPALRNQLIAALASRNFRLYGSADILGAALGGAAKNVIAIAAGIVIGAGLGENARAALITRGLAEIARLALALGGRPETISGLSGLGDLLLTCTGPSSRNFSLGAALGKGMALPEILSTRASVTEGITTAPALLARAAAAAIDMPITAAVVGLLAGDTSITKTMTALMGRALRDE